MYKSVNWILNSVGKAVGLAIPPKRAIKHAYHVSWSLPQLSNVGIASL